jgi:RNA polymerase primary sigma factor
MTTTITASLLLGDQTRVRLEDLLAALAQGEFDWSLWLEEFDDLVEQPGVGEERAGGGEEAQAEQEWEARLVARYEREVERLQGGAGEEKMHRLVKRMQQGEREARRRVVERHLRMVARIARRLGRGHEGVSLLDLIQEGNEELVRVADGYRGKAWTFTDHVAERVVRAVERAVARQKRALVASSEVAGLVGRVRQRVRQVTGGAQWLEREEDVVREVARGLGMSREQVREALVVSEPAISLEELPEAYLVSEGEVQERGLLYEQLDIALAGLPGFTRRVVEMRYGLGEQEGLQGCSVEEVSEALGIKVEEIERLERTALVLLRAPLSIFASAQVA